MTTMSEQVLASFHTYRRDLDNALDNVEQLIKNEQFTRAADLMTTISQVHAKTSIHFRAAMVKSKDPK
jgi:hypothetical protein